MAPEPRRSADGLRTGSPGSVTVLMPVLNEAESIDAAIGAALAQTHAPVEVLVIDGRSSDSTRARILAIGARDSRVELLDNPAGGISAGLNIGLARARGEFAVRLDGHATVNPEYVEIGVRHLREDPALAGVGGKRVGVARTPVGGAIALALSSPFGVGDSINHFAADVQQTDHASFGVYRTAAARAVGGWDEELLVNEDVDFDFRLLGHGHRILYDPEMVIHWNVRETLPDLARQYRRYGRGKGTMVAKNGVHAIRPRHLAAPALVIAMCGSALLVAAGRRRLGLALAAPYTGAVVAATAVTRRGQRRAGQEVGIGTAPTLTGAFVTMHTSWGIGFIEGLLGRRPATASQRTRRPARATVSGGTPSMQPPGRG